MVKCHKITYKSGMNVIWSRILYFVSWLPNATSVALKYRMQRRLSASSGVFTLRSVECSWFARGYSPVHTSLKTLENRAFKICEMYENTKKSSEVFFAKICFNFLVKSILAFEFEEFIAFIFVIQNFFFMRNHKRFCQFNFLKAVQFFYKGNCTELV